MTDEIIERKVRIATATENEVYEYSKCHEVTSLGHKLKSAGFNLEGFDLPHLLLHKSVLHPRPAPQVGNLFLDYSIIYTANGRIGGAGTFPNLRESMEDLKAVINNYIFNRTRLGTTPPFFVVTHPRRYAEIRKLFESASCGIIDLNKITGE